MDQNIQTFRNQKKKRKANKKRHKYRYIQVRTYMRHKRNQCLALAEEAILKKQTDVDEV